MNTVKPIPEGYHSVTPYLVVEGADRLIEFMKRTFGATQLMSMVNEDGSIGHTEMKIGDSVIMLGGAGPGHPATSSSLYVYVEDVDTVFRRAIEAGGTQVMEVQTHFYGDRSGGVKDMCGTTWWIGTHVEDVPEEEVKRRYQEARSAK
jgi:PhnB protein